MQELDLNNIYAHHAPNEHQLRLYEAIRTKGHELAATIGINCPDSREKSIAFTNIETAIMWANASIVRNL